MTENSRDKQLDEMTAAIARSRDELAALTATLKRLSSNGTGHDSAWSGFQHGIEVAGSRGRKVAAGVADELERHPILGGLVAFGVGFGIATLLYKRAPSDSRH
jgi:hypothetical protein